MNRPAIISVIVWAVSIGGLVALMTGERRAVSLRIWLAAFAVWFALATLHRMFADVPLIAPKLRPLVVVRRRRPPPAPRRLREIRALESIVLRARDNERAFTQQLQPRLAALAEHHLPMTHGIDPQREPGRVAELFGPLHRMLEVTPVDGARTESPTPADIDAFLDILMGSGSGDADAPEPHPVARRAEVTS